MTIKINDEKVKNGNKEAQKKVMHENCDDTILYLHGRGADEFDAILHSSFFEIPFAPCSSMQSEYLPTIPLNKSVSCMMLMRLHAHTHTHNLIQLLFPSGLSFFTSSLTTLFFVVVDKKTRIISLYCSIDVPFSTCTL